MDAYLIIEEKRIKGAGEFDFTFEWAYAYTTEEMRDKAYKTFVAHRDNDHRYTKFEAYMRH